MPGSTPLAEEVIIEGCESGVQGQTTHAGNMLWTGHAGDSRAVLCRDGQAVRLTEDHKPELERERSRVEANGGQVDFQRCWRVICPAQNDRKASGLAMSRSLGDLSFKEPRRCSLSAPFAKEDSCDELNL